jgi:23S rRNA G2445 N2-methylase RlmL
VEQAIQCDAHALAAQPWLEGRDAPAIGTLITNPPYGVRIQNGSNLLPLYQTIGHRLKSLGEGWNAMILAHDMRLARRTGLPLAPAFTTKHGGLSVTAMGSATNETSPTEKPEQAEK